MTVKALQRMPRVAAALLAGTAIPANFGSHMFWAEKDSLRKAQQRRAFLTDISLVGALVLAAVDTAGKSSLGWRRLRAGSA
ncbi:MAG: DoxX family protein [Mycobacterium sp.]